jgi:hypothetical protein
MQAEPLTFPRLDAPPLRLCSEALSSSELKRAFLVYGLVQFSFSAVIHIKTRLR